MKKFLFIVIFIFILFGFNGYSNAASLIEDLKSFEESLGEQSITNIESLITDLNAKVDKVEKMSTLEGVKDIVKSFEGTLDVFKKRFSKLAKRLVLTIKEGLKNQTIPTETLVKGIEELNARLSNLESGVVVRKAEEIVEREPEAEIKEKVVVSEAPKEEAKALIKETIEAKGFIDIGRGFFIKNVGFKPFGSSSYMNGEIMNKSDRDYGIADFKINAYNEEGILLEDHGFSIRGLKKDSTVKFEEIIAGVAPKDIAKYAIFFAEMPLVSSTGEGEIKIIGRKPKVAMKETDMKPSEIGKEKLAAKKAWETAKELEGFENIGSGFFIRNVSFDSFGSSSTVTGEIKNNSKKDYHLATFVMKIYSNYGMIINFDFSVRRFKSGDIKPFKEIITGARPVDIDRYEIVLKKFY